MIMGERCREAGVKDAPHDLKAAARATALCLFTSLLPFDTPWYFSSCFKRYVHMLPQEYKRSILV